MSIILLSCDSCNNWLDKITVILPQHYLSFEKLFSKTAFYVTLFTFCALFFIKILDIFTILLMFLE